MDQFNNKNTCISLRGFCRSILFIALSTQLSGCYFFDYFKDSNIKSGGGGATSGVLGQSLGSKAGGVDEAALATLYAVETIHPPAAIRPDPDLYARRLLLQYREEGSTVARQIGAIEAYRTLLGGASEDFQKKPQEGYDATSLLATYTVSEQICTALVNPNSSQHGDWLSILPAVPSDWGANILFLAQRFLGKPSQTIEQSVLDDLKDIMDENNDGSAFTNESYVPVCAALSLDAQALFL
jgi:hypothetical protein